MMASRDTVMGVGARFRLTSGRAAVSPATCAMHTGESTGRG